jgi:phage-related baseplate assembly protein
MSLDLPITALSSGQSGNVLASTITVLASPVSGIDTINNAAPTSGGEDPESDPALRTRFANFFAARSRATLDAVGYAISLVGSDFGYVILENSDATGNYRLGNMLIVVDDGTGSLTDSTLNSISLAVQSVRPLGTTFTIQPPQIVPVQIGLSVQLPTTLSATATQSLLQAAIEVYIINIPIGGTLSLTRISQLAYQIEPRIINVSNVTFNGRLTDMIAPPTTSFMPQSVSFI